MKDACLMQAVGSLHSFAPQRACLIHVSTPGSLSFPEPNSQRGADMEKYSWGQTLSEVTVNVPVPAGTRAKMMDVTISKTKLRIGVKGQTPLVDVSVGTQRPDRVAGGKATDVSITAEWLARLCVGWHG